MNNLYMPMLDILGNILKSGANMCKTAANGVIVISGIILLAYGTFRIVQNFMRGSVPASAWVMPIVDLCFAGIFLSGFSMIVGSIGTSGGRMLVSWTGAGGGGTKGNYGGSGALSFGAFFGFLEDEASGIADALAVGGGGILIITATVELMKILTKPTPAPLSIWVTAFATLFIGSVFQSGNWWTGGTISAKGISSAFMNTVQSASGSEQGAQLGGISVGGGGIDVTGGPEYHYDDYTDGGYHYDDYIDGNGYHYDDYTNGGYHFEDYVQVTTADSSVTQSTTTEPVVTQSTTTEPVVTQPATTEPVVTEPVVTEPVIEWFFDSESGGRYYLEEVDGKTVRHYDVDSLTKYTHVDGDGKYLGTYYIKPDEPNKGTRVYTDIAEGADIENESSGSIYYEADENGEQKIFTPKRDANGNFIRDDKGNVVYDEKYVNPTSTFGSNRLIFTDNSLNQYYYNKDGKKIYVTQGSVNAVIDGTDNNANIEYIVESSDGEPIKSAKLSEGMKIYVKGGVYYEIKYETIDSETETINQLYFEDLSGVKYVVSAEHIAKPEKS